MGPEHIPGPIALGAAAILWAIYLVQRVVQDRQGRELITAVRHHVAHTRSNRRADQVPQDHEGCCEYGQSEDSGPEQIKAGVGIHVETVAASRARR